MGSHTIIMQLNLQTSSLVSNYLSKTALIVGLLILTTSAHAAERGQSLKLVELFTSHGCSSCPPADRLLAELLDQHDDIMALEYHVDYWNNLVHGNDGNFVDPFSKAEFSRRQREYNHAHLAGRPGIYTPQAVINGRTASVGSNKRHILKALSEVTEPALDIVIVKEPERDDDLIISVASNTQNLADLKGIDIRLVRYLDQATTRITGGENRNLTLINRNIVVDVSLLGEITTQGAMRFEIPNPKAEEGCLVIIQEDALTPVFAAAECP